jgi:hypothetical protein
MPCVVITTATATQIVPNAETDKLPGGKTI